MVMLHHRKASQTLPVFHYMCERIKTGLMSLAALNPDHLNDTANVLRAFFFIRDALISSQLSPADYRLLFIYLISIFI